MKRWNVELCTSHAPWKPEFEDGYGWCVLSAREAADDYGFKPTDDDDDAREKSALEWLQNQTQVIEFDGGIVIQQF